ncbi:N-formylglutamate amidohydrolase [Pseudoxanthomonas sacheonensis]|uniref:N-formylglutamate amidohydrolase n=1 Tax=Pseudoxanthomonas sacheonensis TaxID=443615 RepID=UPI0013CF70E0|nr:N-formylglutamate amidohydrolase [Pseudoxanthomonas sacheonensis]KAF1706574.1 N-formylglutamate amidohydrolase [Pseudoxanthomonas sacheonensis]
MDSLATLLGADDPAPFTVHREHGDSPFVLIADHAGQKIPARLGDMGLTQAELDRHIGWDIGIAGLAERLSEKLDAFAILQTYSRLVIDCNRPLEAPGSIVAVSDGTTIPGNESLDDDARTARALEIFAPYHARITQELDRRSEESPAPVLVSLHSFTPVFAGFVRPWHTGVLYHRDARLAHALRDALRAEAGLVVGDNEPYAVSDTSDFAVPVHGEQRGLLHVELEIRQDLIDDAAGQEEWAERLARILPALLPDLTHG